MYNLACDLSHNFIDNVTGSLARIYKSVNRSSSRFGARYKAYAATIHYITYATVLGFQTWCTAYATGEGAERATESVYVLGHMTELVVT